MADEKTFEENQREPGAPAGRGDDEDSEFRVEDRRHWQGAGEEEESPAEEVTPARPSIIDEYRERAEQAEAKLFEYIDAFKRHKTEQDQVRERLARDVGRRVELKLGEMIGEFLQILDDLDLGMQHVADVPEAEPLAQGMAMARDRFLATLKKHGVERVSPEGRPFDPNESEALRVDPVDADRDNLVTETLKPGYKLGDRIIRAAQVAVGRAR